MPAWLAALLTRKMLICIFTGFSSGLPLYLLLNLLPAWLRSEGVDLKTIGFFALIQFPYTWKFLWSPLLDRYSLPGFGRRRGWMLLTQFGLLFAIGALGGLDPKANIWPILWLAALLALLSATQDIAVDAYRRELLKDEELGLGNAVHVNAYRIAGLIPGSLSLILADRLPWDQVFWITGAFMIPGMVMAWLAAQGHYDSIGAGERIALAFVIGLEALGVGLGTAAFVAFIARATHPAYTATQMALFTSLAAVPRTFVNASAGWLVEMLGWYGFFWLCAALAVPGMLLLFKVAPWSGDALTADSAATPK